MFEWNEPYRLVMEMKRKFNEKTKQTENYCLREWIETLDEEKYNQIFANLDVTQFGEYALLKYNLISMYENMGGFSDEDDIYRELRSVTLDLKDEALVLTPFKKFFNLNEKTENNYQTILEKIRTAKIVELMDKLDGSMQNARYYKGDYFMSGSSALDLEKSWRLQDGKALLGEGHKAMLRENADFTFIFEYIGLKNQHVVYYPQKATGLYLIGARNTFTGEQLHYYQIKEYAEKYGAPMAGFENLTLEDAVERSSKYKAHEKEGWILNVDGHLLKIKCDDYVNMHKILSSLSSINVVIELIAEEKYDDAMGKIPQSHQERIKLIAQKIFDYMSDYRFKVEETLKAAPKDDRKTFMVWVDQNADSDINGAVKSVYLERPYHPLKNLQTHRIKRAKEIGLDGIFIELVENE